MPKAEQVLSLVKSHYDSLPERFSTIALQIAAHEAKLGHKKVSDEIIRYVDKHKSGIGRNRTFEGDLQGLVIQALPDVKLEDLIAPAPVKAKIKRIISEFVQRDKLHRHNLQNRRKILLSGPPGTGKTMTASIIANELRLPLYTILLDKMVTKFMGETSAKLRQVFDLIQQKQGVFLFDEFDAIGTERSRTDDVGEMRRVLNSFLQFIERDESGSLIIAATNNKNLLDQALFRRFDDVILFRYPNKQERLDLLKRLLHSYRRKLSLVKLLSSINGLSHADITMACVDAIKETVLNEKQPMNNALVMRSIRDRNAAYHK
jgi:SpoVK/Ycf46/Vps4 family AAA+-type ATPase